MAFDVLKPQSDKDKILFDEVRLTYHGNLRDFVKQKSDSVTDEIVLVGGSTRIPKVIRRDSERIGCRSNDIEVAGVGQRRERRVDVSDRSLNGQITGAITA